MNMCLNLNLLPPLRINLIALIHFMTAFPHGALGKEFISRVLEQIKMYLLMDQLFLQLVKKLRKSNLQFTML